MNLKEWIAPDKQAHFWWGMAMGCPLTILTDIITATFIVAAIATAKEMWYDVKFNGTTDFKDFLVTTIGGAVGAVLMVWLI